MENFSVKKEPDINDAYLKEEERDEKHLNYDDKHVLYDSAINNETTTNSFLNVKVKKEERLAEYDQDNKYRHDVFAVSNEISEVKMEIFNSYDIMEEDSELKMKEDYFPVKDIKYSIDITEHKVECLTPTDSLSCKIVCDSDNQLSNSSITCRTKNASVTGKLKTVTSLLHDSPQQNMKKQKQVRKRNLQHEKRTEKTKSNGILQRNRETLHKCNKTITCKCELRNKIFSTQGNLKIHISVHKGIKYECSECLQTFPSATFLKMHITSVHKGIKYECNECLHSFSSLSGLKKHIYRVHKGIKYECKECLQKYNSLAYLKMHINNVHKRIRYNCSECLQGFSYATSLKKHINSVHKGIKYECSECLQTFPYAISLKIHVNSVHKGIRYECNECLQTFSNLSGLRKHIISVHKRTKYECNECVQKYSSLATLKMHINNVHNGIRYKCNECLRSFSFFASLKRHNKSVHKV